MIVTLGNLYYYPLKFYVFVASYLYFRKLRVIGRENIPLKGPLIYAINHQNALLDALLLSVISWRNPHFLTRADVFDNKYVDTFLRGLKMLPIYRIRDGYDSIKMNQAIFDTTKDILLRGGVVGIFPEGSHNLQYRVRPLKKGVARIAFLAEEAAEFDLNLKIVPIGIQYESHFFSKGRTLISFGKPIRVADFKYEFIKNQNDGIEKLITAIRSGIKTLILHFDKAEDYDQTRKVYEQKRIYKRNLKEQLDADQALVDSIENGSDFHEKSDRKNILLFALENIWLLLWRVVSFVPKTIVDLIIKKTTRDPHFFATMRFAYSIFLYPIILLVLYYVVKYLVIYFMVQF